MKATISFTFATKQYENIKPTIEVEVPDMDAKEAYRYFEEMFSEFREEEKKGKKGYKNFDDMDDDEFILESGKLLDRKPELKSWITQMYRKRNLDFDDHFDRGMMDPPEPREYEGKGTRENFKLTEKELSEPF